MVNFDLEEINEGTALGETQWHNPMLKFYSLKFFWTLFWEIFDYFEIFLTCN